MAEETTDGLLARVEAPAKGREFTFAGHGELDFRTALPEDLDWFDADEAISDFDGSELFTEFRQLWIGYEPVNRDQLEITIYRATIIPERVGLAADYARLFASVWGPDNFGVDAVSPDFGEVMTGETTTGFDRRIRISVWRRGTELLIIKSLSTLEDLPRTAPLMAQLVGGLGFAQADVPDPIRAGLVAQTLRLPSGSDFTYHLPSHWQLWNEAAEGFDGVTAQVYLDRADEGGNSAIGIFGVEVPEGASPERAPLRDIASGVSDVMFENLKPDLLYQRQEVSALTVPAFDEVTAINALYLDRIQPQEADARPVGASEFFAGINRDVYGYAAISAYPTNQQAMGLMIHVNFVQKLVQDDMLAHAKAQAGQ